MVNKEYLDKYLQNIIEEHKIAGMSVAVTDKNGVVYEGYFGVESVERPQLTTAPESLYKIASITKVFNALTNMILVDRGLLELDEPVKKHLPELEFSRPGTADKVTLRHLLTHSTGLSGDIYHDGPRDERDLGRRIGELIPKLEMFSDPGDGVFLYSNYGFAIASYLAQTVGQKPFTALVRELVLEPLQMDRTFYDINEWCTYPISLPHKETDGEFEVIHNITSEGTRFGSGEIFSCPTQLCKLMRLFMNLGVTDSGERIISEETMTEMLRPQQVRDDNGMHSLGLHHRKYGKFACFGHTGWLSAYRSNMFVCPEKGVGVCIMLNTNRDKIRDQIMETIIANS